MNGSSVHGVLCSFRSIHGVNQRERAAHAAVRPSTNEIIDDRQDSAERQSESPGRLADVELHFHDGDLAALKLIRFAIWKRRNKDNNGRNVTFPARQYVVNGNRRSFALLHPIVDMPAHDRLRDRILDAYATYERASAADE